MDPQIQYAQTEDGVSVAFSVMGEGPPLVITPNLAGSHLQLGMDVPPSREVLGNLTKRLQVIRYDCRGVGMSQQGTIDFSAEAHERDLKAVVDRLGLERFAVYGHVLAGEVPFSLAAHYPDRVTSLVFWIGRTVTTSPEIMRRLSVVDELGQEDWDLLAELRPVVMFGLDSPLAASWAKLLRAAHTFESFKAGTEAARDGFRNERYTEVKVPALIAHLAGVEQPRDLARTLASSMPSSHVIAIPGAPTTLMPFLYDNEVLNTAICDFVEATVETKGDVPTPKLDLNAMRAILWTDLEGHSAMMESLGDARGRDVLREHERLTRDALTAHGGTEVKAMGDGFMAWFPSAQRALDCAVALQRGIEQSDAADYLKVRVGVNAGEPIADEDPDGRTDLFGASVIAAARICSEAAGGQIIVSDVVRQLLAGKDFLFAERGAVALKGFEEPVKLYDVPWREGR